MALHLVVSVRLHGDALGYARFHGMAQGVPEWPPSPARLFQALVAASAQGLELAPRTTQALQWLERLPPPLICAPARHLAPAVSLFVPNNDADTVPDPRDVSSIRVRKVAQPSVFAAEQPLVYVWSLPDENAAVSVLAESALRLYQLGRGEDAAWAHADLLSDDSVDAVLIGYRGEVLRPAPAGSGGRLLACPTTGTLVSLAQRHAARKFRPHEDGNTRHVLFANPPKPRLAMVSYGAAERLVVFDLRDDTQAFRAFAASRVVGLVESIRDGAAARLIAGFPERRADVEAVVIGRQGEGAPRLPIEQRTRIIPLPSVGHEHADHAIRRFALQLPFGSPLAADDIEWALAGLTLQSPAGTMVQVTRAQDHTMLGRYTLASARWRSVTAVVLPDDARRRRIAPERQREEAKGGAERAREEALAVRAVHSALRHAGVRAVAIGVRVQREPFTSRGSRVEAFAEGTRFTKERLWHVEIELDREVPGPLVIGDGRFLGLGVMLPHRVGD